MKPKTIGHLTELKPAEKKNHSCTTNGCKSKVKYLYDNPAFPAKKGYYCINCFPIEL